MKVFTNGILEAIFQRRAVKVFVPVEISRGLREQILDAARHAPSSFNMQPYRFYWVGSTAKKAAVAKLCLGQLPAETASAQQSNSRPFDAQRKQVQGTADQAPGGRR